jgi:5-methyltetrahydrofolate--homocysteine methyltransferase
VFYAKDAFEGLEVVQGLVDPLRRDAMRREVLEKALKSRNEPAAAPPAAGPARRSEVKPVEKAPAPPFWGVRVVPSGAIPLSDLWPHLDLVELYKLQWGVRAKGEEYERLVRDEFGPLLESLKGEAQSKGWLTPRVVYGYFPCHADGDELVVLDPVHRREELVRLRFPRQPDERHLCLADWFRSEPGSDVVAFQVVTVGDQASRMADALQERGEYARALYIHGLAVEAAEALADLWHARVRAELGLAPGQGKRYSPGYPAWQDLEDQRKLWKLLDPERSIGVSLTSADQMVPEQSTSAIVLHQGDAVYYVVRGPGVPAVA